MKKMGLILIGIFLLNGCANIQTTVSKKGKALPSVEAIVIGRVILYEKLEITRSGAETDLDFADDRNDEIAQKVITLFRKRFSERLIKKGIKVIETTSVPFIGVDVNLAYRFKPTDLSKTRFIGGQMLVFSPIEVFTEMTGTAFVPHKKNVILEIDQVVSDSIVGRNITIGEPEVLANHNAEQFADVLAERLLSIVSKNVISVKEVK